MFVALCGTCEQLRHGGAHGLRCTSQILCTLFQLCKQQNTQIKPLGPIDDVFGADAKADIKLKNSDTDIVIQKCNWCKIHTSLGIY